MKKILLAIFAIAGGWIITTQLVMASGDVEVILRTDNVELDAAKKTLLASAITEIFPTALPASLTEFYCSRHFWIPGEESTVSCRGKYVKTVTSAEYVDLDLAGEAGEVLVAGANVQFQRKMPKTAATVDGRAKIAAFLSPTFPEIAIYDIADFKCQKNPEGAVLCALAYFDTVSPTDYTQLKKQGSVIKLLRKIP